MISAVQQEVFIRVKYFLVFASVSVSELFERGISRRCHQSVLFELFFFSFDYYLCVSRCNNNTCKVHGASSWALFLEGKHFLNGPLEECTMFKH